MQAEPLEDSHSVQLEMCSTDALVKLVVDSTRTEWAGQLAATESCLSTRR